MVSSNQINITAQQTIKTIINRVHDNMARFNGQFPSYGDGDHQYNLTPNQNWLAAFWSGLVWLTYSQTQDINDQQFATNLLPSFVERLDKRIHLNHDLGFLFLLSARAQFQLTADDTARQLTLRASDYLLDRYHIPGNYIQAWKEKEHPEEKGRFIIDCMMNLPLLFLAYQETKDDRYLDAAVGHAETSRQYLVRDDDSTYHTYFMDTETGKPLYPKTHQGFADDSLWSRGQAWAIFGFTVVAEWTDKDSFKDTAVRVADRYMRDAPPEQIVLWDMRLPDDAPQYPDSSADAIASAGLLRLARLTGNTAYRDYAELRLQLLMDNAFDTRSDAQGLLLHGTQHAPHNYGIDTYTIFGDYFFFEALLDLIDLAPDFWGKDSK